MRGDVAMNDKVERKVGEYEVINSFHIGDTELLLCENMHDENDLYYMTCKAERNELFERYYDVLASDDYVEIASIYADRLKNQVEKTKEELDNASYPYSIITDDMCKQEYNESWVGKIVVVNPNVLRAEYRTASHQIMLCTGGNGANPRGLGTSVFGKHFSDGGETKFYRSDIMGVLKEEYYPEWLQEALKTEQKSKPHKKHEEVER